VKVPASEFRGSAESTWDLLGQHKNRFYCLSTVLIYFIANSEKSMDLGRFGYSSGLFSPAQAAGAATHQQAAGKTGASAKWRRG
jgi:hypothetical protein